MPLVTLSFTGCAARLRPKASGIDHSPRQKLGWFAAEPIFDVAFPDAGQPAALLNQQ